MKDFKEIVGKNLSELRKSKNLTQYELGELFGYSDKAVSKWEQGSTLPDLETLNKICQYYGITIDYLTHEENIEKQEHTRLYTRDVKAKNIVVTCLLMSIIWMLATITFVYLYIMNKPAIIYWLAFIWPVPICSLIMLYINKKVYKNKIISLVSLSIFTWGIIVCSFLQVMFFSSVKANVWPLFLLGIPAEMIIIFSSIRIKKTQSPITKKKSRKTKKNI